MQWERNSSGILCLTAYDGAVEIATLSISGTDGDNNPIWELRCKYLAYGFDILFADTEEQAKVEALENIQSGIESDHEYTAELLKMLAAQMV